MGLKVQNLFFYVSVYSHVSGCQRGNNISEIYGLLYFIGKESEIGSENYSTLKSMIFLSFCLFLEIHLKGKGGKTFFWSFVILVLFLRKLIVVDYFGSFFEEVGQVNRIHEICVGKIERE